MTSTATLLPPDEQQQQRQQPPDSGRSRIKLSRELMVRMAAALNGPTSGRAGLCGVKPLASTCTKMVPPQASSEPPPPSDSSVTLAAPGKSEARETMNNSCSSCAGCTCRRSAVTSQVKLAACERRSEAASRKQDSRLPNRPDILTATAGARHKNSSSAQKLPLVVDVTAQAPAAATPTGSSRRRVSHRHQLECRLRADTRLGRRRQATAAERRSSPDADTDREGGQLSPISSSIRRTEQSREEREEATRSNDSKKSSVIQQQPDDRPGGTSRRRHRRRRSRPRQPEAPANATRTHPAASARQSGAVVKRIGKRRSRRGETTRMLASSTCETTECDRPDGGASARRRTRPSKRSVPPSSRSWLAWPLLLLALWLFLGGGGSGGTGIVPVSGLQQGGPGSSEELKSAVLATMSTRSPPAGGRTQPEAEFALGEPTADSVGPRNASTAPEAAGQEAAAMDVLERLLQFCRIFIMGAIIVAAICGNSLVILSVCRHSKLRVTTNWFVVSLACADILVALFAMTFNASVIASGRWLFKPWVCDFWNSCDVLASTASILHLCCISIDRYIAIVHPLDYPMKITTRRVIYALCGVWISSALLSYIPIFTGIYTTAEHINWLKENPDQCEFVVNRVYAIVSSSISFWMPCCIMVFTYYRIYREASRQEKFIYKAQSMMPAPMTNHHHHHGNHQHGGGGNSYSKSHGRAKQRRSKSVAVPAGGNSRAAAAASRQHHLKPANSGAAIATTDLNSSSSVQALGAVGSDKQLQTGKQLEAPGVRQAEDGRAVSLAQLGAGESEPLAGVESGRNSSQQRIVVAFDQEQEGKRLAAVAADEAAAVAAEDDDEEESNSGQSTPTKRSISKMKREHKAAKTLGIIMGVFIICWLPFFTWYTPQHICGHACDGIVPRGAVTILFWIGYFNSTLNPIIYAYFNSEFRDAFKKTLQWIFCCCQDLKCLRVNRPNDNQHYNCTYRSTQEIGLVSNS